MTRSPMRQVWRPFAAALLLALSACAARTIDAPAARRGVIDLSTEALSASSVALNGEWALYWRQLLTPEDFQKRPIPLATAYTLQPGAWNDTVIGGEEIGGAGYATLRLRIATGLSAGELALRMGTVESAYRLWINGDLMIANGTVGLNDAEESPLQSDALVRFPARPEIELLLQVSNFHYREGGALSPIVIGPPGLLEAQRLKEGAIALLCIGAITVIGLYHLVLYAFRRRSPTSLYFGGYCWLWSGFLLTSDSTGWAVTQLSWRIPDAWLNRVDLLCFVLSVPVCHAFLRSLYPAELSRRVGQLAMFAAFLFAALGVSLPTLRFTSAIPAYYLFACCMIVYFLACLFLAVRRDREGAVFILAGFIILGGAGVNDMLLDMQLIRSVFLMHVGLLVFVLCQAFALSLRFSRAFSAVELLSRELAEMNATLKQETEESNRLAREIVGVCEEERRRISYELHDGLCQQLTGTRLHFSVLRRKLAGAIENIPESEQLSAMLESLTNQAYELSHGLWPVDHGNGSAPSLQELIDRLRRTSGVTIELHENRACTACPNPAAIQMFRIAQEAVTNALRHARAGHISVRFDCSARSTMRLVVADDGIGRTSSADAPGLGMRIMEHRARSINGQLEIGDDPAGGTQVSCTAPCAIGPGAS